MKHILVDLDGTLLDFNKGEKYSFIDTIKEYTNYIPSDSDCLKFSEINEYYFNQYRDGNMDRPKFHELRFLKIKEYLNLDFNVMEANAFYINKLKYASYLYDDVIENIEYLSQKYDLYIASNGMGSVQRKRVEEISKYFKGCFISEEVGANKPDIKFFEFAFKEINDKNKDNYLIIGDRLDTDILGGKNAGIKTMFLNRDNLKIGDIVPDYEIKSLDEIKKIL